MSNTLSKALMKSLQKAYGQYAQTLDEVKPRTYNSIYSRATANSPSKTTNSPSKTIKPKPYVYQNPNFLNNTVQQSNPNLELQEFQQAQRQLLQNQRMQQMYATTRNAGQMTRQTIPQMPAVASPTSIKPISTQPPTMHPQPATTNYGQTSATPNATPKATTSEQSDMTKPTTSIEDTSPAPSTGASILGTTTKRYSGIRKSSKATAGKPASTNSYTYSSQYMHEGTGKVPNLPSTDRSIPHNQKYF